MLDNPLWKECKPLWPQLLQTGESLAIAGGFGLLLKQEWLRLHPNHATVVPLVNWVDATPRVTKDLDIVVGLDLLASKDAQQHLATTLQSHGFIVVEKNPRWQFAKQVTTTQSILIELHAALPPDDHPTLTMDKRIRVKYTPSLGEAGVHGRQNPEAFGAEIHPFLFELEQLPLRVPNPLTWLVMKLTAAMDRWREANHPQRTPEQQETQRLEASKHAHDATRIVAMTSREESDRIAELQSMLRIGPSWNQAQQAASTLFIDQSSLGRTLGIHTRWQEQDYQLICESIQRWFLD